MNAINEASTQPAVADVEARRSDRARLTAYVRDRTNELVLREALSDVLTSDDSINRADFAATRRALQREMSPGTLILDVSGEANAAMALDDLAQFVEPGVRVLVIGDTLDLEFYRLITRSLGVLEYLPKPLNRETVARFFRPLVIGHGPNDLHLRSGRVITVTGVRGGVGATTIAANLATHLGETTRRHTLLMDADLHSGTAALMLSADCSDALYTALEHPERVDDVFLQRAARKVNDRLHVMCSEENLSRISHIRPDAVRELLDLLRQHYNFVVIDVPRQVNAFNRAFLDAADQRVLVMDTSIGALRDAVRFMGLPASSTQSRPPIMVMNRTGHPGTLKPSQVVEKLGYKPEVTIPYVPKLMGHAATMGTPVIRRKTNPMRSAITRLSQEIITTTTQAETAKPKSFLQRMLGA